jgi:hypothetical protein
MFRFVFFVFPDSSREHFPAHGAVVHRKETVRLQPVLSLTVHAAAVGARIKSVFRGDD